MLEDSREPKGNRNENILERKLIERVKIRRSEILGGEKRYPPMPRPIWTNDIERVGCSSSFGTSLLGACYRGHALYQN